MQKLTYVVSGVSRSACVECVDRKNTHGTKYIKCFWIVSCIFRDSHLNALHRQNAGRVKAGGTYSKQWILKELLHHTVRHPRCVFINYNWINPLSNTTVWWLDICCLLHRYQLHVSALMAIFRLID